MRRVSLALALVVAAWAVAAQPVPEAAASDTASQRATLEQLRALNAAKLPDGVAVASLFAVRLDDPTAVQLRLDAMRVERAAIGASDDPSGALRRELLDERLAYLEALARKLGEMPDAARRILPGIAEPRAGLREHAQQVDTLAQVLGESGARLDRLRARLDSGALVGFLKEARDLAKEFEITADELRVRSAQLREAADAERQLAEKIEADARALRREFFTSLRAADRAERMDAAFLVHLEEQRRLQRVVGQSRGGAVTVDLAQLTAQAAELPPQKRTDTVAEAAALSEPLGELLARSDVLIDDGPALLDQWRFAFENEVVTVLSAQISDAARREAYAFSASLLRDARAETSLAWERATNGWTALRGDVPSVSAVFATDRGRSWLIRGLALCAVVGLWSLAQRYTGKLVVRGVRSAAEVAGGRIRIGTLVRWSGLLQATFPVLLVWPLLWAIQNLLGEGSVLSALVRAVGVPFFWYALGLQLMLGSTRRVTAGRPALIEVAPALLPKLKRTYARLGLFVAAATALHGLGSIAVGEGVIVTWIDGIALAWVGIWAAWEAVEWRPILARSWQRRLGPLEEGKVPGAERRVALWMEQSRWAFWLSPLALLRIIVDWLENTIVEISRRTDLAELIAARRLRRAAKNGDSTPDQDEKLPEEYLREFPLKPILGEDDALLLPKENLVNEILEQIERWRQSGGGEGSIAVVGPKGSGKTTLAALVARKVEGAVVVQDTLRTKPADQEELYRSLAPNLPVTGAEDFDDWIEGLCAGPERVVFLDEAHNIFLRAVGGFDAYDALVELVNATSKQIFWVLLFNSFTWRFLNESRSRLHYFRRLLEVPAWDAEELRELISRRHRKTGFEVDFDEMLLSGERSGPGRLELVEGSDGFFRLLKETSGGNPRIASRLWLSSLSVVGEKKLRVSTFREPQSQELDRLSDDLMFALAAIAQHENLSTDELRRVLNVSEGLARFAVQFLSEAGLVVTKDGSSDRVTLAANYYRQVLRALRNKHLLFE